LLTLVACGSPLWAELQFADLGDFALESGEVVEHCKIAYRTYGTLNAEKSNVILWPTWFSGSTKDLESYMDRETGWVDVEKHFVVTVGALGNGVSSSPSNSESQSREKFPNFTISDMVRTQRALLEREFGVVKLHAVMGISMGGMQTFQWAVMYPDAMERAIPIVGSPRLAPFDLLLWKTQLKAVETVLAGYEDPVKAEAEAMALLAGIHELALTSPAHFNAGNARDGVEVLIASKSSQMIADKDPYDWAAQLRAMIDHDVTTRLGGSLEAAGRAIRAEMLVIVSRQDHMVTPEPALEIARQAHAETLILETDCGHLGTGCSSGEVRTKTRAFLD
jgi:homoserine O-acetyltransferase